MMIMRTVIVLTLVAAVACAAQRAAISAVAAPDPVASFIGVWEYRQRNLAAPSGYDPEGERLEIRRNGRSVIGLYFGLEREGEHGLFYTATEVADLAIDDEGRLRFTVPERRLFAVRPLSIEDASVSRDAGRTRDELKMIGRITNGYLVLDCVSGRDVCPDGRLVFSRIDGGDP